jgi:hypothetical protein
MQIRQYGDHIHLPIAKEKIKCSLELRESIKQQLADNPSIKVSQLHMEIQSNAKANAIRYGQDDISPKDYMSKMQLYNLKSSINRKELPSSDTYKNLHSLVLTEKALEFSLAPHFLFIIATKEQITLIGKQPVFMIDTTFEDLEQDLYLTTLLLKTSDKVHIPVSYVIHNKKTEAVYSRFLTTVKNACPNHIAPLGILHDYDPALFSAVHKVFPGAQNLGDTTFTSCRLIINN